MGTVALLSVVTWMDVIPVRRSNAPTMSCVGGPANTARILQVGAAAAVVSWFMRIDTVFEPKLATARSGWSSPFRSPAATEIGAAPPPRRRHS